MRIITGMLQGLKHVCRALSTGHRKQEISAHYIHSQVRIITSGPSHLALRQGHEHGASPAQLTQEPRDFWRAVISEGHYVTHVSSPGIPTRVRNSIPTWTTLGNGTSSFWRGRTAKCQVRDPRADSDGLPAGSVSLQVGDLVSEPKFLHL